MVRIIVDVTEHPSSGNLAGPSGASYGDGPTSSPPPPPLPPRAPLPPTAPLPPNRAWAHTPLRRPRQGGEIGGVVRALATGYGFDPKPVRIGLVIASFFFPPLVAAYIVAWIALPQEPSAPKTPAQLARTGGGFWGIVAGLGLMAWVFGDGGNRDEGLIVAGILVGAGVLLWRSVNDRPGATTVSVGPRPDAEQAGYDALRAEAYREAQQADVRWPLFGGPLADAPGADPVAAGQATDVTSDVTPTPTPTPTPATALVAIDEALVPTDSVVPWGGPRRWGPPLDAGPETPPWHDATPERARRSRLPVTRVTLAAAPVVLGVALAGDALGWWDLSVAGALAVLLATLGAGLILGAAFGAGRGLLVPVVLLLPVTAVASIFPTIAVNGAWGDRMVDPATTNEAAAGYRHGIGKLTIDLSDLSLTPGGDTTVPVVMGVGELRIAVPDDVDLVVDAKVGAGAVQLEDRETGGTDLEEHWTDPAVGSSDATVTLDLRLGVGKIDIVRTPTTEVPR